MKTDISHDFSPEKLLQYHLNSCISELYLIYIAFKTWSSKKEKNHKLQAGFVNYYDSPISYHYHFNL